MHHQFANWHQLLNLPALIIVFIICLFLFGGTPLPGVGALSAHSYDRKTFNRKLAIALAVIAALVWIAEMLLGYSAH